MEDIKLKVKKFLVEEILNNTMDQKDLSDDRNLTKTGLLDSIAIMRLLTFLTVSFKFDLIDEDFRMENFESINNICNFVNNKFIAS